MPDASATTALLGPTNTGKTHRAIERMLEHRTGMVGLPLRLLAREVYDKISARIGEAQVALVTGEEQRVPARPSYWVATVEAMPVDREVEFVAIDEVQLAAHEQRGHVFTQRILSARGTKETWLLGADTMRPILAELVPAARQVEHPRLSRLTFSGAIPLSRVPPRSAVVAFSMAHVYELAERLRAKKGGAAVVLGGLSPRTRNAQVAMFQSGEVDWLVATDAIGMGLNLDVEHVAFAAVRKFDGRDVRDVEDAELAQIAGRAGRWIQDGTFGTLTPLDLPRGTAMAIESHRFAPVRRVRWRNDDLSFSSVRELRASLAERPRRKVLVPTFDAEDAMALARIAERSDVAAAAQGEDRVRLLWEVCTVPDFKKLLFEAHADFLAELFLELTRRGRLGDDWIDAHVRPLDDPDGDVEMLVARIASTRTWTYVANRAAWLRSPGEWQERTLAIEDRLSDALHARLVSRFVDSTRARSKPRQAPRGQASRAVTGADPLARVSPDHPFAKLAAMRASLAAAHEPRPPARSWVDEVIDAPHAALRLSGEGHIVHAPTGRIVGSIAATTSVALPDVRLAGADEVGAGARSQLHRRLLAFARDVAGDLLGRVRELGRTSPSASVRGLVHRLEQGLGTALARDVADVTSTLSDEDRAELAAAGLALGAAVLWMPRGLAPAALEARAALASARWGTKLAPPKGGAVSLVPARRVDPHAYAAMGFPVFGPRAIRADVAERLAAHARGGPTDPRTLASWAGCTMKELPRLLAAIAAIAPTAATAT